MRLKSLWIDGFKNLKDFKIDFKSRDGITVLIGNNASGKSNILEAISAIFAGLYNDKLKELNFKFDLTYNIDNLDVRISKKQKVKYRIKNSNNKTWNNLDGLHYHGSFAGVMRAGAGDRLGDPYDYRPSQVIALYSGEELRLWGDYYQKPYFDFNDTSLKNDVYLSELNMLYINKHYWDIALLTMFASDMDNDGGIKKIVGSTLKEIKFEINVDLVDTFIRQKPDNVVNNFIWDLLPVLANEHLVKGYKNAARHVNLDLSEFKERTNYITHSKLFALLCVAKLPKDLKNKLITNLELHFENGTTTKDLSEGQKKQILLKLALEVLADENSLLLFDEPDAHIHISNKKLIPEMLKDYDNREIILTTHSPTLAHSFDNKHIAMLGKNDKNNPEIIKHDKQEVISQLTDKLWNYHEQGLFFNSKDLVLLVEGNSDKKHIETAFDKLKDDYPNLEFSIFSLCGAQNIKFFMNGIKSSVIRDKKKTYIGIFDYDAEGRECSEIISDKNNGKIKKYCKLLKDNKDKNQGVECGYYHMYLPYEDVNTDFEIEQMYPEVIQKEAYKYSVEKMESNFNAKGIEKKAKRYLKDKCDTFNLKGFAKFKDLFDLILKISLPKPPPCPANTTLTS